MKMTLIVIAVLFMVPPVTAAPDLFKQVTPAGITDVLARVQQASVTKKTRAGTPVYILQFGQTKAVLRGLLCKNGSCRLLRLSAVFSGSQASLEALNRWNAQHRFSRAFRDEDGDIQLVSDLDLDGGVNDHDVRLFIDVFGDQANDFLQVLK